MKKEEKNQLKKTRGKKLWIGLVSAALAFVFLGGLSSVLSHAIYGRSLAATVYMYGELAKEHHNSYEEEVRKLESIKAAPEETYKLPKSFKFYCGHTIKTEEGMQVYYVNPSAKSDLVLFYIHGGAYVAEPAKAQWSLLDKIAKQTGVEVVAPIYPLAPHHTYEEAYEKLLAQYTAWRLANPGKTVVFMGDSAGGGLALGRMQRLRDSGSALPSKAVLLAPWVDLALNNPDIQNYEAADPLLSAGFLKADAEAWAGETDVSDGKVSTLNADLSGLPETLIVQGTADIFYPDVMLLADKMKAAGVSVKTLIGKNLPHVYSILTVPESRKSVSVICSFIQS